jgi:hypothetical protein
MSHHSATPPSEIVGPFNMVRVRLRVESQNRSEQVADTCDTQLHQSERPVVSKVRNYNKDNDNDILIQP